MPTAGRLKIIPMLLHKCLYKDLFDYGVCNMLC